MKQTSKLNNLFKYNWMFVYTIIFLLIISACSTVPELSEEMRAPIEASDCSHDQCIDFIYLHGSRPAKSGTSEQEQESFNEQIELLHNWVSAELYKNKEAQEGLLKENSLRINPEPVRFYWGNMSKTEFEVVQEMLHWSSLEKGTPGWLTRTVQKLFITGLHDTYWIGKYKNTRTVNLAIHNVVKKSINKGRKVVLLGHSAGGMAIQRYALYHLPYMDLQELRQASTDNEVRDFLKDVSLITCARAMLESGTMEIAADGRLLPRLKNDTMPDMSKLRNFRRDLWTEKIKSLPIYTEKYCIPAGNVLGLVTYGNPAPVLEASIMDDRGSMFLLALRYMLENKLFWLNINHINDPLGYSIYDGHDLPHRVSDLLGIGVDPKGGFFISGTDDSSVSVANAHSWYWLYPNEFANALTRIYAQGYRSRFYSND